MCTSEPRRETDVNNERKYISVLLISQWFYVILVIVNRIPNEYCKTVADNIE